MQPRTLAYLLAAVIVLRLAAPHLFAWWRRRRARAWLGQHYPEVLSTPKTHKVLIVSPSTYLPDGTLYRADALRTAGLAPILVAALTPPHWDVEVVYEICDEVPLDTDADLVAIGNMGHSAWRAWDLATEFQARGKYVVMAGTMTSMIPDYAQPKCDTLLVGEVEETWVPFLQDYEAGAPKPRYEAPRQHPLDEIPLPRYDILFANPKIDLLYPVQIGRGCPYRCKFCSINALAQGLYTGRDPALVKRDIEACKPLGVEGFFFLDDNIAGNHEYATRLFEAVTPLGIRWVSQSTLDLLKNDLLPKAVASGAFTICFGMESLQQKSLNSVRKGFYRAHKYEDQISTIRDAGMLQTAEFIIGMDHDTPETLDELAEFIIDQAIPMVRCYIYSPIPGTPVYEQFKADGRLLTDSYEGIGDARVAYQPVHFTPDELIDCYWKLMERIFEWPAIFRRVYGRPVPSVIDGLLALWTNWNYRKMVHQRIVPGLS